MESALLLIVEDDELIRSSLARALTAFGFRTAAVGNLAEARRTLESHTVSLVVLDLGLPDGDGLDLCHDLAAQSPALPIIVVTARSEEVDIVKALRSGAVDYVVKPFKLAELHARIQAHLRFQHAVTIGTDDDSQDFVFGPLRIRRLAHQVLLNGVEVPLRPREFNLLVRLAVDEGKVVTRERLIEDVWDQHWWGPTKTLDVHVNTLRRKLGVPSGEQGPIITVRGVGYRLNTSGWNP